MLQVLPYIFLALLLFALTTAIIAANKGRNGLGWFFIGLISGPIGLVLAAMVSETDKLNREITID